MPKIPEYKRTEKPQLIPGVRVSPEAMTKDLGAMAGFGQAVTQAGQLGMQFATKLKEAREVTEHSNAKSTAKEGWNNHKLALNELDYNLYEKETKKAKDRLYKEISSTITEKNAKVTFDRWWQDYTIGQEFAISKLAQQKEIQVMAGDYYKNLNVAAERGDIEDINSLTLGAISGNIIRADVGEKAKATALRRADAVIHKRIVDTAWFAAMSAPDRKTAIEIIKEIEGLSGTERNSLISAYKREQDAKEAKIKTELETAQRKTQNDFIKRVDDTKNPLGYAEIENSNLEPVGKGSKSFFKGLVDKKTKATLEDKLNPLKIIDPAVDYETMQKVYSQTPPQEDEITALVGEGLSVKRAEHWLGILKKPDRGYKRALDYLKSQIMPSKGLLVGESSEEATAYWNSVIALDEQIQKAIDDKKPLTGNEILKESMKIAPIYMMTITERIEALKRSLEPEESKTVSTDDLKKKYGLE